MSTLTQNPFAPKIAPKGPVVDTSTITQTPDRITRDPQAASTNPYAINPFASLGIINPQAPNYSLNPIPKNFEDGLNSSSSAIPFVQNFKFTEANRTGDPAKDLAQTTFNKIKDQYGHNAAWTWMLDDAWNYLGGYGPGGLRAIMDRAGIDPTDSNRLINTYGSTKSKYFSGLVADNKSMGTWFNPSPELSGIMADWTDFRKQQSANYGNKNWKYTGPTTTTTTNPGTNTTPAVINTTPTVINTTPQVTNTNQSPQTGTNFFGYNPYANTNLAGNPYSTQGIKPVPGITTTTTNQASGDTSIIQNPVTGVS